ncbi:MULTISPECIES: NUDIX domain-containing protein [Streptomyces]|uniref:NUDIX hydrolase n=1 Tax=Streptomyces tsukubensis (strain DSM 42081 / NBRC 108919 / NRRL 18488 / 9993) TaxID=1114943 RepID=I2N184_STRT9|nr:NUDIX hydrolase [Streptomyces tsukubensis]MYS64818.1 NUDIX domain-containing protein [Streptomyces sp. SID5473]AZK94948.1 NUDIX hydrolase [Streptomyces tsukubensis]EIF90781.1 NUDIX hydrolase [Streptomyces tsukubensis NRRL18488]QKM68977.1 NUDIX hydrolase [Streptomyces tsukubensis NRRL18488]TAI40807.1 NUDIX hydrolase [Streptomyces tsukubensis]
MSEWKALSERTVYENRWVRVGMADVVLPDGRHLDHTVIRLRPVAVAAVVNDADEVLLLWRHRFITGAWGWELPSGGTAEGEDPGDAAAREFEEETGWRPGPMRLLLAVDPMPGISTSHHRVYWSDRAERIGEPRDGFESARREWVPLSRVPVLVARGEIRSANTVAALLMLHHHRYSTEQTSTDLRQGPDALPGDAAN